MALRPAVTIHDQEQCGLRCSCHADGCLQHTAVTSAEALHRAGRKKVHTLYLVPGISRGKTNRKKKQKKTRERFSTFIYVSVGFSGDVFETSAVLVPHLPIVI